MNVQKITVNDNVSELNFVEQNKDQSQNDLNIGDSEGNVILKLKDGQIETKNFDSRRTPCEFYDDSNANLNIGDENGNVVLQVKNGHIKTKNFDSSSSGSGSGSQDNYNELRNKRVCFIGDSLTAGDGRTYHKVFADLTGCVNVNLGISGTSIATRATYGNRFYTRATAQNLSNASLIVVFGGTNDFDGDVYPIGDLFKIVEDEPQHRYGGKTILPPDNTEKFGGAMHQLILTIQQNAPGVPVMFMTPLHRDFQASEASDRRPNSYEYNNNGNTLQEYRDAINTICEFYGIPVFQAHRIPQLNFVDDTFGRLYSSDRLHPNTAGHNVLGHYLYNWVRQNIKITFN